MDATKIPVLEWVGFYAKKLHIGREKNIPMLKEVLIN